MEIIILFQLVQMRVYKDLFDMSMSTYHMKQILIIWILQRLSDMINRNALAICANRSGLTDRIQIKMENTVMEEIHYETETYAQYIKKWFHTIINQALGIKRFLQISYIFRYVFSI